MFEGIPRQFNAGRYHSLYATKMPDVLSVTATAFEKVNTGKEICMGIQHKTLPSSAVQFHPESILTPYEIGLRLIANAVAF